MAYFSIEDLHYWPVGFTVAELKAQTAGLEEVQQRLILFALRRMLRPPEVSKPLSYSEVLSAKTRFSILRLITAVEDLRVQWKNHAGFFSAHSKEYQLSDHPIYLPPAGESGQYLRLSFETAEEVAQELIEALKKLA